MTSYISYNELSHSFLTSSTHGPRYFLFSSNAFNLLLCLLRGITLVSCFSKIFTGVLNNRIMKWAEENDILSDAQFGFRKNRSTVDAIFVLNAIINKMLNERRRLYCAFVDLKTAFDHIYRNALWCKLYKIGVNLKMVRIVKNVYSNVKSCIRHCNTFSDFFDCAVGLRQGEVLSPLMFFLLLRT